MNQKRTKMCTCCDGFVDLDVIVCPYCGSDLSVSVKPLKKEEVSLGSQYRKKMSVEETLSSLYPPPYNPKHIPEPDIMKNSPEDQSINNSRRFNFMDEEKNNALEKDQGSKVSESKLQESKIQENSSFSSFRFLPILLFSLGVNVILLGLYLLIFSTNGEIFIRWNAAVWYVYLLVGVPCVAFGYKMLSKLS
jgi:hypothetical protein